MLTLIFYRKRHSPLTWRCLFSYLEICRRHTWLMWFGTEEDSPTNKAKSLGSLPPFIKGAIAPSTTRTRTRAYTRACVRVRTRTRVHTRVRVHRRASFT
nr:MAG TPA: hypothetical protein [Microviridae sp.]